MPAELEARPEDATARSGGADDGASATEDMTEEELLARISKPILSAVFTAVGEVYDLTSIQILKNHPKGRRKGRETLYRAQQAAIFILHIDYGETPENIGQIFAMKFWQMSAKCRGIMVLAELGSEFMENVNKIRAKLRERGVLPL